MSEFAEGWYEFVTSVTATTEIAYVHESGDLYVPNSSVLDWEHATRRERLIRADELDSALASERAKRERAERAMKAEEQRADVNSDAAVKHDRRALAAEATIAQVRELAAKHRHGAERWADPLPVPGWVMALEAILAAVPTAALDAAVAEVRAGALEEAAEGWTDRLARKMHARDYLNDRAAEIRKAQK